MSAICLWSPVLHMC